MCALKHDTSLGMSAGLDLWAYPLHFSNYLQIKCEFKAHAKLDCRNIEKNINMSSGVGSVHGPSNFSKCVISPNPEYLIKSVYNVKGTNLILAPPQLWKCYSYLILAFPIFKTFRRHCMSLGPNIGFFGINCFKITWKKYEPNHNSRNWCHLSNRLTQHCHEQVDERKPLKLWPNVPRVILLSNFLNFINKKLF